MHLDDVSINMAVQYFHAFATLAQADAEHGDIAACRNVAERFAAAFPA